MRPLRLIGILLVGVGGFLLYTGGTFTTRRQLARIGDVKLTAPEEHRVPLWMAGAMLLAGVGVILVDARRGKG